MQKRNGTLGECTAIHLSRVAQEHEEQLRRMRELEERLAADRMDRLTVGHDRR